MRDPIRPQAVQECAVALHTSARIEIQMTLTVKTLIET